MASTSGSSRWKAARPERGSSPPKHLAAVCDVLVEAPGTIEFTPPHAVRYGGLGIAAKIDRRVFVGATRIAPDAPVELGEISHRLPETGHYQPLAVDRRRRLDEHLEDGLRKLDLGTGIRLHIASELPFYRGFKDSTVAVGIAVVLQLTGGALDAATLEELCGASFAVLRDRLAYRSLFRLAWQIEILLSRYRPEGHHIHGSLASTRSCTVFWRDSKPALDVPQLLAEDPFERLHVSACCLSELAAEPAELQLDPLLAVDLAAVFVGPEHDTGDAYSTHRRGNREMIDGYTRFAVDALTPHARSSRARFLSMVASAARPGAALPEAGHDEEPTTAAVNLMDLSVIKSMEVFAALAALSRSSATEPALDRFIRAVDQAQDIYRLLNLSKPVLDEACYLVRSELISCSRSTTTWRSAGPAPSGPRRRAA